MNTREQLNDYLRALETRLRWMAISKGVAVAAGVALGATLALVLITNALAFSDASLIWARVVLFLALAAGAGLRAGDSADAAEPQRAATEPKWCSRNFEERLLTYVERNDSGDPMIELLADDTQSVAKKTVPRDVAPQKSIFAFATGAGAAGAALLWMILAGPGFLGYGAALLWAGAPKSGVGSAFYDIQVQPGNKLVRRKDDVPITATLIGFQAPAGAAVRPLSRAPTKWEAGQHAAARQRLGLRVPFRGAVRSRWNITSKPARVKSKTYQAGRDRSSRHHAHQDHLSFPVLAGTAGPGGGSQRRSARGGGHGGRGRGPDRPAA